MSEVEVPRWKEVNPSGREGHKQLNSQLNNSNKVDIPPAHSKVGLFHNKNMAAKPAFD